VSTRDSLSQLSEEELEKLYQEQKADYEQKTSKNRRIRGILSRKVNEKQNSVDNLKKEINDFLSSHPELSVAKENFYHILKDNDLHHIPRNSKLLFKSQ
jgi:hypothetical protein